MTTSIGRITVTPRQLVLELNAEATDYTTLGNLEDAALASLNLTLLDILNSVNHKLTYKQILACWPPDQPRPHAALWKWLSRGLRNGLLLREGRGTKSEPYRYWTAASEQRRMQNPLYRMIIENWENQKR